jgi:hypothetical protein
VYDTRRNTRRGSDSGILIEIGAQTFVDMNWVLLDAAAGRAGAASHRTLVRPISISDGVWIRAGTQVLPAFTIGVGEVIDAGSMVTPEVPQRWRRPLPMLNSSRGRPLGSPRFASSDPSPVGQQRT